MGEREQTNLLNAHAFYLHTYLPTTAPRKRLHQQKIPAGLALPGAMPSPSDRLLPILALRIHVKEVRAARESSAQKKGETERGIYWGDL
jgi:hypothetical protein